LVHKKKEGKVPPPTTSTAKKKEKRKARGQEIAEPKRRGDDIHFNFKRQGEGRNWRALPPNLQKKRKVQTVESMGKGGKERGKSGLNATHCGTSPGRERKTQRENPRVTQ